MENIVVDAVITWVNGNDPVHKKKIENYLKNNTTSFDKKSIKMRFGQVNEIEFTVKSILKYAKFVRNIYIVTDNQVPDFLKGNEKSGKEFSSVFIVDHKTIFEGYNQYLPTFNSRSIETQLSKIPNLAEHFIYFNDDIMLLKETNVNDFFIDGYPILRGKWKKFSEDIFIKKIRYFFQGKYGAKKNGHKIAQQNGAKLSGFKKYFKFHHTGQPIRKSTLEIFFNKNETIRVNNIKYKLRNGNQFLFQTLANHIEIKNKTVVLKGDYQLVYFQNYNKPFWWIKSKLKRSEKDKNKLFLCLQSLDQCSEEKLSFIKKWLSNKYN